MSPALKSLIAFFILCVLGLAFPILLVMAFYAESGSQTMNLTGILIFIPYSIIAILALISFFKNISRIFKNL